MSELLQHVERHLGPRTQTVPASSYAIGIHTRPDMVTAVTDGMRRHSLRSALPLEFACSARPGQESSAVQLVSLFADTNLRSGDEVEYDDGLLTDAPLLPSTSIQGLLAAPHPYADEMFNLFRTPSGELSLQFITLVPVTATEGRYLRSHETGELFELWESLGTDLLDLHRAPSV
jgi:hypothetical protein